MSGMSVDRVLADASTENAARCNFAACGLSQNVGNSERLISAFGGGVIGLFGLHRGGLSGLALAAIGGSLVYRGITGHCHAYSELGISSNRDEQRATGVPAQLGVKFETTLTINRPAAEIYDRWRRLESLPNIMRHLQSVHETGPNRSHWVAQGPMGMEVEWDSEIINEDPARLIAWRSLPGSQVDTAGSVHFEELPGDRGTRVSVSIKYNPPGGRLGAGLAGLLGESAEQEMEEDLRRFKQIMETGEVTTTEGQPSGRPS